MSPSDAVFAIVCCQNGADPAVKAEVARDGWRLAYSRRGFLSFKNDSPGDKAVGRFDHQRLPRGVFVRTASWSLGLAKGEDAATNVAQTIEIIEQSGVKLPLDGVHIWPRDRVPVGKFDFEPGIDEVAMAVGEMLVPSLKQRGIITDERFNRIAKRGDRVLDIVLVEPAHWAIGWHPVPRLSGKNANSALPTMWPGGVQPIQPPGEVISRAYFKAAEAIAWSGFELRAGDRAIEIGASPGGACSLLLEMGLNVIGIDPAEMDEEVMEHENFRHIRARAGDIPRSEYEGAKWLLVDSNVRPDQTLTTVEHIVTHRGSTIEGMILTLKVGGIAHADRIDGWVRKVKSWGATDVVVRQLARSKIEVCLVARMRGR
jgi:23S rRNA (cytidine2498-2'-O)-methyltransferase